MLSLLIAAFIMGGLGSVHCVGMCGPLALSLPVAGDTHFSKFTGTFLYNLGRICTYAALGTVLGAVGSSFAILGLQQALSIVTGIVIIVCLIFPQKTFIRKTGLNVQDVFAGLRKTLGILFRRRNYPSLFGIGVINGLLPCGLVYMAAATALATGSVLKGSLFMAAFGLGTFPLMWSISFFGNFINARGRSHIRKAYPYLMFIMACLLIVRGLSPVSWDATHSPSENITNCFNPTSNVNGTR